MHLLSVKFISISFALAVFCSASGQIPADTLHYAPFIWKSEPPPGCPFGPSKTVTGIRFTGSKSGWWFGDTWYPTWASDDKLYSPWTDGHVNRLDGTRDQSSSLIGGGQYATTGQGVMEGDDPMTLKVYSLGIKTASALPYAGRYPSGSLVYNGVWYYSTYCLGPSGDAVYGNLHTNWPWMGPTVGFRYSTNYGKSWEECPLTPSKPLFGETGINGYPVKIGSPHFVDFGKNMQYSPDGKAYLIAHGADTGDVKYRFWNDSWVTGDQIYLLRVTPSIENINDRSKYEYYGGKDRSGQPIWTNDFKKIKPLLEWNDNMGCVNVTYNPGLKKYLMCVTDGGNTVSRMNTYILEADELTGNWKLVTYMKNFGEQAYFVNFPSKFISKDGRTAWLLYSANVANDDPNSEYALPVNPPGSKYGITFQKVELLGR